MLAILSTLEPTLDKQQGIVLDLQTLKGGENNKNHDFLQGEFFFGETCEALDEIGGAKVI